MWSTFEPAVSDHSSFSNSQTASWLSVRATSRPRNRRPNRIASRPQARCRSGRRTVRRNHHAVTAVRLSESMRREMRSARPFTVNNSGIDARNGQAYHGRKTIATNGTRPAALGSRSGEGQRAEERQRRQLASCVRSCTGATGRARVLRAGTEAATVGNPVRCKS
jgi:hypothetical protein